MVLVDPDKHKARIVSAGPTTLIRFDARNSKLLAVQSEGIAMGFDKGPVFDRTLKEVEVDIQPGDRLVLATEGLFRIKNHEGAELGTKGFARFVARYAASDSATFSNRVVADLDTFAGGEVQAANITLVTIKRKENG
jgi:serine phosphatase RsbU (regulator of sigma subunit)